MKLSTGSFLSERGRSIVRMHCLDIVASA